MFFLYYRVKDSSCGWTICRGGQRLGFGFGVGDDPDAPVGLDIEGYDVACGQLSAICAFWGAVIPLRGHKILCPYNRGRSRCSDLPVLYERGIGRGHLAPTEYGHAFDSRKCKGAQQCAPCTQVGVRLWRTTEESLIVAQG